MYHAWILWDFKDLQTNWNNRFILPRKLTTRSTGSPENLPRNDKENRLQKKTHTIFVGGVPAVPFFMDAIPNIQCMVVYTYIHKKNALKILPSFVRSSHDQSGPENINGWPSGFSGGCCFFEHPWKLTTGSPENGAGTWKRFDSKLGGSHHGGSQVSAVSFRGSIQRCYWAWWTWS